MSNEIKTLKTRIQNKHDLEANWTKAENFIPLAGEVIVYDQDDSHAQPRIKIGDGKTVVNSLPFCTGIAIDIEGVESILDDTNTGWLKDPADNQKFAPKTTTNQVLTENGENLTTKLETIDQTIGAHVATADIHVSDADRTNWDEAFDFVKTEKNKENIYITYGQELTSNYLQELLNKVASNTANIYVNSESSQAPIQAHFAGDSTTIQYVLQATVPASTSDTTHSYDIRMDHSNGTTVWTRVTHDYNFEEGFDTTTTTQEVTVNYENQKLKANDFSTVNGIKLSDRAPLEHNHNIDWNNTTTNDDGYIANKPIIKQGQKSTSIVIGTGDAQGEYSVAGGTNDSSLASSLVGSSLGSLANIDKPTAYGNMSLSFGAGTKSYTSGAVALGAKSTAGAKGFYWWSIDFTNKKITLATNQITSVLFGNKVGTRKWDATAKTQLANWKSGDKITLVANVKYGECSTITAVDSANGTITVDSLPITEEVYPSLKVFDDYAVYVPAKPAKGVVQFALGGVSIGLETNAAGSFSMATGWKSRTMTDFAHAEGIETVAGYASHAEGNGAKATGKISHAEGYQTTASGYASHAEGDSTVASHAEAHAEGGGSQATAWCSHAEGHLTQATNSHAHAEGDETEASGTRSHAEGYKTKALNENSHAEGYNTQAIGGISHAEGHTTEAKYCAHAEGGQTKAYGNYSHTEGNTTQANGSSSHSEGMGTVADKDYSHAEGKDTKANGTAAHAEGGGTIAKGTYSHSEGHITYSQGSCSHSEGDSTNKITDVITVSNEMEIYDSIKGNWDENKFSYGYGVASHTEGKDNISWGARAHAEGYQNIAKGENSHAEGYNTRAIGSHAHAEGHTTEAKYCAHAEGGDTKAHGNYSHAEGNNTQANASASHSEGIGTKASSAYQHVQGKYNVEDTSGKYVHIVGWGSSDSARANIHTLDTSGNAWFKGDVEANGVSLANVSKIAEDADSAASELKEYSGVIDVIDVYNISDPDERAIYRMPLYYLIIDGKFHDYATVKIRQWAQLPSEPGEPAAKDFVNSRGDTVDYYTVYLNLTDEKYYVYYNSAWSELSSVASSLFGENYSFAGTYTNASEIPTTNSVAILKTSALYTLAYGRVTRVISNRATSYFGESFNSIDNKATGSFSHAEGVRATASGYAAHAEGDGTAASGPESHTEGGGTEARGWCSHAEGYFTVAAGSRQHVQGKYNIVDNQHKYAHIVGNGTNEDVLDENGNIIEQNRSNAHTLDWQGNAWYAKSLSIGRSKLEYDEVHNRIVISFN